MLDYSDIMMLVTLGVQHCDQPTGRSRRTGSRPRDVSTGQRRPSLCRAPGTPSNPSKPKVVKFTKEQTYPLPLERLFEDFLRVWLVFLLLTELLFSLLVLYFFRRKIPQSIGSKPVLMHLAHTMRNVVALRYRKERDESWMCDTGVVRRDRVEVMGLKSNEHQAVNCKFVG